MANTWCLKDSMNRNKRHFFVWSRPDLWITSYISDKWSGISCFSSGSPSGRWLKLLVDRFTCSKHVHGRFGGDASTQGKLKQTNHIHSGTGFAPLAMNKIKHSEGEAVTCFFSFPRLINTFFYDNRVWSEWFSINIWLNPSLVEFSHKNHMVLRTF